MNYIFTASSTAADLNKQYKLARSPDALRRATARTSITVLSNVSTQYLVQALDASLVFNGVNADIYESSFDQWEFELGNPDSQTYRRDSDYVLIVLSSTRLILGPCKEPTELAARLRSLIVAYKARNRGEVILVLPEAISEGFDQTSFFFKWVRSVKTRLQQELQGMVHFVDIDPLIMEFGLARWRPSKFLISGKFSCHPNCFPLYGNYLASFIGSLLRRPVKLVIVDLDNTLWDGVVGEVGWEGVGLDRDGVGYHHLMLQSYLLSLKQAGVLLAICSKNSIEVARSVFEKRKEMVLKFDDFVAFEISWDAKSGGIQRLLGDLNLTETGVMFLDDSKFEREVVKNSLPEVYVPELPENVGEWCEFLSRSGFLTIGKISDDDLKKTSLYLAERQRKEDAAVHGDYSAFLGDLGLVLSPSRVSAANFDRVLELIHKTNQFNLTTQRVAANELAGLASRPDCFCFCYGLEDKYSNYGIISVFIAEKISGDWRIHTWLMSCRVMGRGVEDAVFDHFVSSTVTEGESVLARYAATEKNKPVAGLLQKMGFTQASPEDGASIFTPGTSNNPKAHYIELAAPDHREPAALSNPARASA